MFYSCLNYKYALPQCFYVEINVLPVRGGGYQIHFRAAIDCSVAAVVVFPAFFAAVNNNRSKFVVVY